MVASSRSRTRADAAAERRTTRSAAATGAQKHDENVNNSSPKAAAPSSRKSAPAKHQTPSKKTAAQPKPKAPSIASTSSGGVAAADGKGTSQDVEGEVFCSCKGPDDGSPMVKCEGQCKTWYHLGCIDLSEEDASEIDAYFCKDCEAKLGVKTIMDWEGPDAFVEIGNTTNVMKSKPKSEKKVRVLKDVPEDDESDESDEESEDNYVAEEEGRMASIGKRRTRRISSAKSLSDSESDNERPKRIARRNTVSEKTSVRRKGSLNSPALDDAAALKRRGSLLASSSSKKARTASDTPSGDDPMRKYCLSKLNEIIRPMFVEQRETEKKAFTSTSTTSGLPETEIDISEKPKVELTEDEKAEVEQKAASFVAQLEACMMDEYAEPDKTGRPHAGGKYKERFRMLSFNLAKEDRVALRKGIASGRITPAQINTMSSTDLANEQTKAEIEAAEAEALQQNIMPKLQAPSAKMTHKGIEMIEENISETRNQEDLRQEEEERIENERRERERLVRERERQRSLSMALPPTPVDPNAPAPAAPHSPVTTTSPSGAWGLPPQLPAPLGSPPSPLTMTRPPAQPLFVPSESDYTMGTEGELTLADLINIDDDLPQDTSQTEGSSVVVAQPSPESATATPEIVTPSGPSPFAQSKPISPARRTSFDLNALWTGEHSTAESTIENEEAFKKDIPVRNEADDGEAMEIDSADDDTEERTLDAILDDVAPKAPEPAPPPPRPLDLNLLPKAWSGTLSMPYDANTLISPSVVAKQIAGRSLDSSSSAWGVLFPSSDARIDGRVPVPNSSQYLINMRLNASKELIAVCLQPESAEHFTKFNELCDFLMKKSRHGLIFPWGMHPKPTDPGRELYIIPLKKEEPIPEYVELMDNLQLPKDRPDNILIGVFVLSKGKLKDEPIPTTISEPPSQPQPNALPLANVVPPSASQPPLSSLLASLPQVPGVDQTALAAEVASLTPEQISMMLRTLSQTVPAVAPPLPIQQPPPSAMPLSGPHRPPGYPTPLAMPPVTQHFSPPSPQHSPQGRMSPRNGYDDRYDRHPYEKDDGRRGGRGRSHRPPRPHGRGRPQDTDRDFDRFKDRDSGWRGRGRG